MLLKKNTAPSRAKVLVAILALAFGLQGVAAMQAQEAASTSEAQGTPIAEVQHDGPVDFEKEILPLLKKNCLACHNATKAESKLVLETPQSILKGGDSGPAVMPMKSAESLLLQRASGQVDSIMPPKDNKVAALALNSQELGLLKLWIDQGATGNVTGAGDAIDWQSLPAGVNPIYAVAVTPDGQFAACGRANQIYIYHLPSAQFVCQLTDPELLQAGIYKKPGVADLDLIQSLAFSPDGTTLASGGYRTIKIWRRPRDVRELTLDTAAAEGVASMAVSKDGKWLATSGADNAIRLWDLQSGQMVRTLAGHSGTVTALRFNADSTKLWSASADKTIRGWQLSDGAPAGRIDTPTAVQTITLFGDGSQLASGGADNLIRLWTAPTSAAQSVAGLAANASALAVSPDKKSLVVGAADGSLQVVDLATLQIVKTLTGHTAAISSLAFQANGTRLASGSTDKTLRVWDLTTGQLLAKLEGASQAIEAVALHPSGNQVASGASDGGISLWKLDVPSARTLPGPGAEGVDEAVATAMAVSRDGRFMATGGTSGGQHAILVRDVASGAITQTLLGHTAQIVSLAFSVDQTKLVSGSDDNTARVWNLADGKQLAQFAGHTQSVSSVAFNSNGLQVISGSQDQSLRLWHAADGTEVKSFAGHAGRIVGVAMASGDQRVISVSEDQTLRIWNAADAAALANVALGAAAGSLGIARDESRVAVACADNNVRVYQLSDNQLLATLAGQAPGRRVEFSADQTRILVASADHRVNVWDVARSAIVESLLADAGLAQAGFGPTANEVLLASADKFVRLHTLHFERALVGVTSKIAGLAYSPDGGLVYCGCADGTVRGFQSADAQPRFSAAHGAAVNALVMSADGKWLASAGDDQQVRVWAADGSPAPKPQFGGFTAPVKRVAFSLDSLHVVGASSNANEVLVYNLATGEAEQAFTEHGGAVLALAGAGDLGTQIVSLGADNGLRVWPILALRQILGHTAPVTSLEAVPTAPTQILAGSQDGTVRLWNTADGAQIQQMAHGTPVTAVAVRPDGLRFASAGGGNVVRLWNAQNFQQVAEMKGDFRGQFLVSQAERSVGAAKNIQAAETAAVTAAEQLATAEAENVKKATEALAAADKALAEKTEAAKVAADAKAVSDTALADATAASKAADEAKLNADKALADADAANKAAVDAVAAAKAAADKEPDNKTLAEALANAEKAAVDAAAKLTAAQEAKTAADKAMAEGAEKLKVATDDAAAKTKANDEAEAARKSAETSKLASDKGLESANNLAKKAADAVPVAKEVVAMADARIKQRETELEAMRAAALATEQPIRTLAFSPDNVQLASGGEDRMVHTWNAETGAALETYTGHTGPVLSLAYASDRRVVSGSADKQALVWDANPVWSWERTIGGSMSPMLIDRVTALDFSPDGKLLASGGGDPSRSGELKIWNVSDGTLVREIVDAHSDTVLGIDFSPEGNYLASCAADKFVKVFDVATGTFVKAFEGHTHHVLGVAWRADSKVLASCGADNVIKVWDFATGEQKTTIAGFAKEVTSISFIGEGSLVLTSSGDKVVRRHNVDNAQNTVNYAGAVDFMYSAATTPDGKIHIGGGQDSILREWNGENGQEIKAFPPPQPEGDQQASK